jgi:tryptophan synthase alpha chain
MPFVVAGYPTGATLSDLLRAIESAGADAVEIGIPFSDPIADGPVIAAAMHDALVAGVTVDSVLAEVAAVRSQVAMPLVAMVSVSIVDRLGGPDFIDRLADAGFDGVIVPDADLDAIEVLREAAIRRDLAFTTLIAPDTSVERAARIAEGASGFVYVLARRGLTGERQDAPDVTERMASLREVTDLPLVAGFGISTAEHVVAVLGDADGAIVGSALVRILGRTAADGLGIVEAVTTFVRPLADAVRR